MENSSLSNDPGAPSAPPNKKSFSYIALAALLVLGCLVYFFFISAPGDFPVGSIAKIEEGGSLRSVSLKLKQEHIIRSRLAFEAFVIIFDREKRVISTDYYFENKLPIYEVAWRISK